MPRAATIREAEWRRATCTGAHNSPWINFARIHKSSAATGWKQKYCNAPSDDPHATAQVSGIEERKEDFVENAPDDECTRKNPDDE